MMNETREREALRGLVHEVLCLVDDGTLDIENVMRNQAWIEAIKALGEKLECTDSKKGPIKIIPDWV